MICVAWQRSGDRRAVRLAGTARLGRTARRPRRGAIAVLTMFVLVAILSVAGLLLSLSYIELAETELQAATDAAARSAVIRLVISQSETEGRRAAMEIAARHRVGGRPFALDPGDIVFGNSERRGDGSFSFRSGRSPLNAVQVLGSKTRTSSAGSVSLPFGSFVGRSTYDTQRQGAAMRLDHDIVLVLDRSGSMGWDLSQLRFSYPPSKRQRPILEQYFSPPDPNHSRWAVLSDSVSEFLDILSDRDVAAKVGLVTFASDYSFGDYESQRATVDSDFRRSLGPIAAKVRAIGDKPLIGGTDIAAGLYAAEQLLTTSPKAQPRTAEPVIVLFSDGIFTEGDDPVQIARSLHDSHGIVIHSVTFGAELAARQTMDGVASNAGSGLSLHADNASQLIDSFRQIANSIPVIVTQ